LALRRSATFADDIFYTCFAEDFTNREAWRRYRKGVLEPGASSGNELVMLEEFLGRKVNLEAFFSHLD
jgi:Zn-dependent oligopeptidase